MLRAGVAILCVAATCQAFYVPLAMKSSWLSTTRQQDALSLRCYRRPRSLLGMTEAPDAGAEDNDKKAAAVVEQEGATGKKDAAKVERGTAASGAEAAKIQPKKRRTKRKKRVWPPAQQAYLDKIADAPVIYKRYPDFEFYPSVGYDSAYPPLEESLAQNYTGDSTVINEDGTEEVLMRVVILGGGDEEGQFVKNLSEKGAGKLVDGLYVLWDPREGDLSETVAKVDYMNVHELGTDTRKPEKVAKHASFLGAHMLVAVKEHPSYGADFVPLLKKATLEKGLTFVGPSLAAEVAKGDMAAFTKLVQDTRAALAY